MRQPLKKYKTGSRKFREEIADNDSDTVLSWKANILYVPESTVRVFSCPTRYLEPGRQAYMNKIWNTSMPCLMNQEPRIHVDTTGVRTPTARDLPGMLLQDRRQ